MVQTKEQRRGKKPIYVRDETHARIKDLAEAKGYALWKWVDIALNKALDNEVVPAKSTEP